jgi:spore coat protein CotH
MFSNKQVNIITAFLVTVALAFSFFIVYFSDNYSTESIQQPQYIDTIFDSSSIMTIDISVDEDNWNNMIETATEETYINADIKVNGTTYYNVAIRPKGNSSLRNVFSNDNSDRYSFKIKFDEYVDGQTLDGLSKLVLNNNISDPTYMKEYLSYDLLSSLGIATPAYAYANISVNGDEWGLYLAVEPIEDEFIDRNFNSDSDNLYKPEGSDEKLENGDADKRADNENGEMMPPPQDNNQVATENGRGQGKASKGSEDKVYLGSDLVWTGDDISKYSEIFDNSVLKTTKEKDYVKIIDMLEHLDTLDNIEEYLDVDEVLKYFAVNTFLVNLDSYASSLKHNYYLYEDNGIVSVLPWDYNLAFGGFQAESASSVVNFPIDMPVTTSAESSPLICKLLENDEYKELYHSYLSYIVDNYVNNGTLETKIYKIDSLITDSVEADPTAFYTFEEYKNSLTNLLMLGEDRAKSIIAQLKGTQPTTTTGNLQTEVDISALGGQGGQGENGDKPR